MKIYNLAAQSHVWVSSKRPNTANADAVGALRILEAIRILKIEGSTRFYQASTSELYGKAVETPQRETTPFDPRSPRRRETLRLLDHGELPGGICHPRFQWHPFQPRKPCPR